MNKVTKVLIGLGMIFAVYTGLVLIEMTDEALSWQGFFDAGIFLATAFCFWGLWRSRAWALGLSYVLALAALAWGGFLVHFVLTFWIFDEPTVWESLVNVLHPRVSVFVLFPLIWLFYFSRAPVRAVFKKGAPSRS